MNIVFQNIAINEAIAMTFMHSTKKTHLRTIQPLVQTVISLTIIQLHSLNAKQHNEDDLDITCSIKEKK